MDVKKLIVGFLILTAAAASSAAILSTLGNSSSSGSGASAPQADITAANTPDQLALSGNAFLPEAVNSDDTDSSGLSELTLPTSTEDPNNLTNVLADGFLNGVVAANPDGPTDDDAGNPTLNDPDLQTIAMAVATSTAAGNVVTPDWDLEAESQPIKIINNPSSADIATYTTDVNDIYNKYFTTSFQGIIGAENPDPSQITYVASQFQEALGEVLALQTPSSLVDLQKNMVKVLVYEKNEAQLIENINTDPVKTNLILQNEEGPYDAAVQDLDNDISNASGTSAMAPSPEKNPFAFLTNFFGVETAHAQLVAAGPQPVIIITGHTFTFSPDVLAQMLQNYLKDIALQILKNVLIALIQKKVLTWIQGKGVPRFVQQWGTTLVNAYTATAIGAINSQMACVFPAFGSQMKLTLGAFYKPGNNICANTFQAALAGNSFQQFYNNFARGGFIAYGASMLPSGNYYGGLFFNAQVVGNTSQNAQQAASAKAIANNGNRGDQVCPDGTDPNGEHWVCENPDGPDYTISANEQNQCTADGGAPVLYGNAGMCPDNNGNYTVEPTVTTPGTYTGFAVSSALDSNPKLVTAATNIVGVLNAVLTSLLNSLASLAVSAVTTGVNGVLTGGGSSGGIVTITSSTIQGGGTSTVQAPMLTCNPFTQTASSTTGIIIEAVGGALTANGQLPNYSWTSSNGQIGSGQEFTPSAVASGTYTATVNDSTGDPSATCTWIIQ